MRCSLVRRLIISLVGAVISIAISADEQPNNRFVSTAQPLPSWIAAFTGDAELQIERIVIGRDELQNVVVPIHFGSRNFSMRGAQGAIGSGSAALDWHHDIASARNSLTLAGHDLRAGDIATLRPVIDAPIDFHIELDGQGRSLHEFLAGARGYVKADLGAGAFASNDLERAGRDLLSYMVAGLNPFASRQGETPFKCARARFAVHRGDVPELQLFGL
ncbi:MAG: hypothetical protein O3C28_16345 [Proteobacteria bacterium]|nr:hypothetical protein [Pseudomonadota bacterium]